MGRLPFLPIVKLSILVPNRKEGKFTMVMDVNLVRIQEAGVKRLALILLSATCLVSLHHSLAQAAPLVLTGDYIRVSLNDRGTLGQAGVSPGLIYDTTGTGNFPSANDWLTPGIPFEGFSVTFNGTTVSNNNNIGSSLQLTGGTLTDMSGTGADHRGVWTNTYLVGGAVSAFTITNDVSFNEADKALKITTTIHADAALTGVQFSRQIDPDVETPSTTNTRGAGTIAASDIVTSVSTGGHSFVLSMYTTDAATHNTAITSPWSQSPAVYLSGQDNGNGDNAIGLGFDIGDMDLGDEISLIYYYLFGDSLAQLTSAIGGGGILPKMTTANNTSVASVFVDLDTTGDPVLSQITGNLLAADVDGDNARLNRLIESISPTADNGAATASVNVSNQALSLINNRLDNLNSISASSTTGLSSGDSARGLHAWMQGFGARARQDSRGGVAGYGADTYGIAAGVDTRNIADDLILGIAGSYGFTDVNSKNANMTGTDIDSYQVTLYGTWNIDSLNFINAMGGYAYNNVNTRRYNVGGTGVSAHGHYGADQYVAQVKAGHMLTLADDTRITPSVLANWTRYSARGYTETGAGGASQVVGASSANILEIGIGAEASHVYTHSNGSKTEPSFHAGYRYDLIGDTVDTTARFTGGGAAFTTDGLKPARGTINVGLSLKHSLTNNAEFSASWDYEAKADYHQNSGMVRFGYRF